MAYVNNVYYIQRKHPRTGKWVDAVGYVDKDKALEFLAILRDKNVYAITFEYRLVERTDTVIA